MPRVRLVFSQMGWVPAYREAWRIHGEIGSAVETWEPFRLEKDTEALDVWMRRD